MAKESGLNPWVVYSGIVVLGVGLGMAFNMTAAGSVIGVGLGFLAVYFLKSKK